MHKRSLLWAGAGVLLLTNPGFGAEDLPDGPSGEEPLPVPLASVPADYPPGLPPPSRPRVAESRRRILPDAP